MSIEICDITKHFGPVPAVDHVSLHVATGELVALLGPSGCGKTTLLRIVAGLEPPDAGSGPILFHDENVAGRDAGKRGVGFVFQHYALFRHMTVFENIAFGLRVKPRRERPVEAEIRRRVNELIHLIQLETFAGRYPHQLSGGQRQRVALARALAVEPKVLLLDEPFGALDAKVRVELRRWLRRLHDEIHVTSVFVTHDQDEALEVADRIVVMHEGRIIQVGKPEEVFHHPATEFVMHFLGQVNQFHGRLENGKLNFAGLALDAAATGGSEVRTAKVMVRPHEFDISLQSDDRPAFPARIERIHAAGSVARLTLVADSGETFHAEITQERLRELAIKEQQRIHVSPRQYRVFADKDKTP